MDLDDILRVERCRDKDELNWSTVERDPDHSPDAGT